MTKKTTNLVIVIAILVVLIVGIIVAVALTGNTREYTYEIGDFEFTRKGDVVTLTSYTPSSAKERIEIPTEVDGFSVTRIGDGAFENNSTIKELKLDANISSIGNRAFKGMTKLSSLRMESVTSIGDEAFMDTKSLAYINMPDTLSSIGARAFQGCSALSSFGYTFDEDFVVKSSLGSIGEEAFKGSGLRTVVIPSTMKSIGKRAFALSPLSKVIFYEGVETIGEEAFFNLTNSMNVYTFDETKDKTGIDKTLGSIHEVCNISKFPASLKVIERAAFKKAKDHTAYGRLSMSNIDFGANIVSIGDEAFMGADIRYIKFANPKTTIGKYAFSNIQYSLEIDFPAELEAISEGLLLGTTMAWNDELVVPATVKSIGVGAFAGSKNLFKIKFAEGSPLLNEYEFRSVNGFSGLLSKDGKVLYSLAMSGQSTIYDIPDSVETIEMYALSNVGSNISNDNLAGVSINIPRSVKAIKANAFLGAKINSYYLEHDAGDVLAMDSDAFGGENNGNSYVVRVKKTSSLYDILSQQFAKDKRISINTY